MKHFVRATTVSGLRYSGFCGGVDDCVFQNLVSSKPSLVPSHRSNAASVTIWTRSPELRSVHIQTFTVSTDSSWLFSLVSRSLLPVVVYSRRSDIRSTSPRWQNAPSYQGRCVSRDRANMTSCYPFRQLQLLSPGQWSVLIRCWQVCPAEWVELSMLLRAGPGTGSTAATSRRSSDEPSWEEAERSMIDDLASEPLRLSVHRIPKERPVARLPRPSAPKVIAHISIIQLFSKRCQFILLALWQLADVLP